jgi:uncharacterized protein YjdB
MVFIGLLLFFTIFLTQISSANARVALASSVDTKENSDYRLNLKSIPLVKGKQFNLKVYNLPEQAKVSYKSDNSEVASVNDEGVIDANNVGSATITVTVKDGSNPTPLTCDVTVGPAAFSVKMTRSRIILSLDKSDMLKVILKPSNTTEEARFSSYDSSIATVSSGGRVTARKLGFTYIFAEIDMLNIDGTPKFATCGVIVTNSDDAQFLESYFADHSEFNAIPENEMEITKSNGTTYKVSITINAECINI